ILFLRVLAINPPNDWVQYTTEIVHSEVGENRDSVNRPISSGNCRQHCFTDDFVRFTEDCIVTRAEAAIPFAEWSYPKPSGTGRAQWGRGCRFFRSFFC